MHRDREICLSDMKLEIPWLTIWQSSAVVTKIITSNCCYHSHFFQNFSQHGINNKTYVSARDFKYKNVIKCLFAEAMMNLTRSLLLIAPAMSNKDLNMWSVPLSGIIILSEVMYYQVMHRREQEVRNSVFLSATSRTTNCRKIVQMVLAHFRAFRNTSNEDLDLDMVAEISRQVSEHR